NARNGHAANDDRVIDDVREDRILAGRRENAHGEDGARRVLGTRERKEVGNVARRLANRARTINVIGHCWPPSSAQVAKPLQRTYAWQKKVFATTKHVERFDAMDASSDWLLRNR